MPKLSYNGVAPGNSNLLGGLLKHVNQLKCLNFDNNGLSGDWSITFAVVPLFHCCTVFSYDYYCAMVLFSWVFYNKYGTNYSRVDQVKFVENSL